MFEVGFSELLVICALALIVLGPRRLPRVASQVGRWVGRARAMARQFREQLEVEAHLEEALNWQPRADDAFSHAHSHEEAQAHARSAARSYAPPPPSQAEQALEQAQTVDVPRKQPLPAEPTPQSPSDELAERPDERAS